jgi:GT2 family glycosyltransferase
MTRPGVESGPLFTIVIAVMNGAAVLERCLDSIAAQSCRDFEVLVADGVSRDGTQDILRRRGNELAYWRSARDRGVYDAWNTLLPRARGEWICFLGADDRFSDAQVLERLAEVLRQGVPQTIVYGRLNIVGEDGRLLEAIERPWPAIRSAFFAGLTMIPHPGCLHHRSVFERRGQYDAGYRIAGDYDLLLRELGASGEALYLPQLTVVDMQIGGISGKPENLLLGLREIRRARSANRVPGVAWRLHLRILLAGMGYCLYRAAGPRALRWASDLYRVLTLRKRKWTVQ